MSSAAAASGSRTQQIEAKASLRTHQPSESTKPTPSAPAYEDVNSYWHDRSPAPHRATTITATQPTPPPNSLGLSFYNGADGSTQQGYRYTETRLPYTAGNDTGYGEGTGQGSFDTGYGTGYGARYDAGRHIDNRRGYQGRQRSSLSPPRYAGPAFAYSPYRGGHIANGDHRYRHRSSFSPATPRMAGSSTSACTPASQHPESQNIEAAAYQGYRPYPLPDAAMCGGNYAPPPAGYLPSASGYPRVRCRYSNDYSLTQLGATSWVKMLEKTNLQPRLAFLDRGEYVEQAGGSEDLYPLAFSGQRYTRRGIWVTFDVAADSPNLKRVKRFIRGLTAYQRVVEEKTETKEMPSQARGDSASVSKAGVAGMEITQDRDRDDTVATAGTASTSKAKETASSSEKSRKRKAPTDDDDNGIVGTKGSASTSKAKKTISGTTFSEKRAGKRRVVAVDVWAGSEPPRPLSPLDKARRRYGKPAQHGASSSATTYSRTTAVRMDQKMMLAGDGSIGGAEGTEGN